VNKLIEKFEPIYYYEWYDGPKMGVADFNGNPYYFESEWNHLNDSKIIEIFRLSPVNEELLELSKESWSIWKRWENAFKKKQIEKSTHPYLPEDKIKGEKINEKLKKQLKLDKSNFFKMYAEFKPEEGIIENSGILVKWIEIKTGYNTV